MDAAPRETCHEVQTVRCNSSLGLILFSTGGAHDCGFDLVVEQVRAIGPGAWIQLITGAQLNGLREAMAKVRRRSVRARIADSLGGHCVTGVSGCHSLGISKSSAHTLSYTPSHWSRLRHN
jgi:hypothetical protein